MCAECENTINNSETPEDIILLMLSIIGGLVENYVEDGYCDPLMYKAVKYSELITKKLEMPNEIVDKFTLLKIQAGEVVEEIAKREGIDLKREDWS